MYVCMHVTVQVQVYVSFVHDHNSLFVREQIRLVCIMYIKEQIKQTIRQKFKYSP